MKPRHMALGAALLAAAALVLFGDRAPDTDVAQAVDRPAGRQIQRPAAALVPAASLRAAAPQPADAGKGQPIQALVPREVLIGDSETGFGQDQNGAGAGSIFGHQDWTPPPPPQPVVAAAPPPPPTAPPLPFTFIGKSVGDGAWEVYLARGDRTYVVRAHEVIDGTYRVDAIAPPLLTLTYLPLNQVQQLHIGVFE
jgi:hypothetical protein